MKNTNTRYTKTVLLSSVQDFPKLKAGQWIQIETGSRGQYLGTTNTGSHVVRWQPQRKFETVDAHANKPLRAFAKLYGSK